MDFNFWVWKHLPDFWGRQHLLDFWGRQHLLDFLGRQHLMGFWFWEHLMGFINLILTFLMATASANLFDCDVIFWHYFWRRIISLTLVCQLRYTVHVPCLSIIKLLYLVRFDTKIPSDALWWIFFLEMKVMGLKPMSFPHFHFSFSKKKKFENEKWKWGNDMGLQAQL